jgi:hypothetical protein
MGSPMLSSPDPWPRQDMSAISLGERLRWLLPTRHPFPKPGWCATGSAVIDQHLSVWTDASYIIVYQLLLSLVNLEDKDS